ncbi:MAG TPA: alpha/beta fold hydrolase [Thermoleophilaceae bacterium]|nr:alpha/beta fold hydrolase [Thermoleophilaceae bacterium]
MTTAIRQTDTAPTDGIASLAERFDADVMHVPSGRARVRLAVTGGRSCDAVIAGRRLRLRPADENARPDCELSADAATWRRIAADMRGGMDAFRAGRLQIRGSLHVGVGFLAATNGSQEPGRLEFDMVRTRGFGSISVLSAGTGPETIVCLHGLGGTKASFLPTVSALADSYRVVAIDLPGFGESDKPIGAPYDAAWFARSAFATMDALGIERAHVAGNSMGGRVAIEAGLMDPDRTGGLLLLSPALAWLRSRPWAPVLRALRPELGLIQPAPRPVVEAMVRRLVPAANGGWTAAGVDEFLRAYLSRSGRAAFYAAARNIYLDEPHGENGFWTRLESLQCDSLFVWGKKDKLVPIGFMKHVEKALPKARHVELNCGHVPQVERPRESHAAIRKFLADR